MFAEALLATMLTLPPPWTQPGAEEPAEERRARLQTIAEAIAIETARRPEGWRWERMDLAALLLATTYEEGHRWSADVHSGRRTGDRGRARCLAQVHVSRLVSRAEWLASTGTDLEATRLCMRLATRVLAAAGKCVSPGRALDAVQVARIVAAYGSGRDCNPKRPFARSRARLWTRLVGALAPALRPAREVVSDHLPERHAAAPRSGHPLGALLGPGRAADGRALRLLLRHGTGRRA